ncbi:MAG: hypothetical protein ABI345_10305 [Jatrophihabitans sp.]
MVGVVLGRAVLQRARRPVKFDTATRPQFDAAVDAVLNAQNGNCTDAFSRLPFIDASGRSALVGLTNGLAIKRTRPDR